MRFAFAHLFIPFLVAAAPATVAPPAPATKPPAATTKPDFSKYVERWVTEPKIANPLLKHAEYQSAAMKTAVGYNVYLPPGYDDADNAQKRYPVIYWLHGLNQSENTNQYPPKNVDAAIKSGAIPPIIVIYVSGGGRTFYVDSADGKLLSETTLTRELIPHVDATYRTIAKREGRAIQGMSMGGWGALRIAMGHPELFSSVVAFAPSLRTPENLAETYPDILNRMFGGDSKRFWAAHPLKLARDRADVLKAQMPIAFYCGNKDHLLPGSQEMKKLLVELGIPHEYAEVDGAKHDLGPLIKFCGDSTLKFAVSHFK
ncbi:MAG TPA: alpha/beta hydrolase-fold protein [Tepidisphaeraceae bacterium]|nr:alpha/beta hydrolase-fold protein [Tepidisphaeraceae bacterium]